MCNHSLLKVYRTFWSNHTSTSIKVCEHTDWYLLCAEMHIWQDAAAAFGQWPTIKRKEKIVLSLQFFYFEIFSEIFRLNETFSDIFHGYHFIRKRLVFKVFEFEFFTIFNWNFPLFYYRKIMKNSKLNISKLNHFWRRFHLW